MATCHKKESITRVIRNVATEAYFVDMTLRGCVERQVDDVRAVVSSEIIVVALNVWLSCILHHCCTQSMSWLWKFHRL